MYGYFDLDHERGAHPQMNVQPQPRCYKHDVDYRVQFDPFMFIGKFGDGRRFRCPMPGCDNMGPIVADYFAEADQSVEDRPSPPKYLSSEAQKEATELAVFGAFAKAAKLPVDSVENAKPPHPDIRCTLNGQEYWFELGRVTSEILARKINPHRPADLAPFSFSQEEPFAGIIGKKVGKNYETNGQPVDLVLHFDHHPPDRDVLKHCIRKHAAALAGLRLGGPFSRVWIYDDWSKSVLWTSFA